MLRAGALLVGTGVVACHGVERLVVGPSVDHEHPTQMRIVWHTSTASNAYSYWFGQPALDGGQLFVENGNKVLALDAATGRVRWGRPVRIAPSPVVEAVLARAGRVYIAEVDSILAMDEADGHTIWNFRPDSQAAGALPAVDNRALYAGQRGIATVYALSIANGQLLWRRNVGSGWTFPGMVKGIAVSGDTVYVNAVRYLADNGYIQRGVLVALSRTDGSELWRYEMPDTQSGFHLAPAVSGRFIVVSDVIGNRTFAFDRFDKQLVWSIAHMANSTPVIVGDTVFGASSDTYAWAARLSTGTFIWQKSTGGSSFSSTYCAGAAFVNEGMLQRLEARDGSYTGALNFAIDDPKSGSYTSAFATDGKTVYFTGQGGVYAVACR